MARRPVVTDCGSVWAAPFEASALRNFHVQPLAAARSRSVASLPLPPAAPRVRAGFITPARPNFRLC